MNTQKFISVFILIILLIGMPGILHTQTFEEYKKQQEEAFSKFKEEYTLAYEAYVKKEQEGIEKLRREVEQYWGEGGFKLSTQKEWVDYSEDKKSRTDVDFEAGVAKVEVLLTPDEAKDTADVQSRVSSAVEELVFNTCTTYDYIENEEGDAKLMEEPVLDGQLTTVSGQPVSVKNADAFINEVSTPENIDYEKVDGVDGNQRIKATITIKLIPEHVQVRAKKFLKPVDRHASRFEMPKELIFAVIETESSFNPLARSHIPAYGLMQIVPRFAGREAYYYIYKKDTILQPEYLYKPQNNIELGTAYFNKLMNHYFKNVEDTRCRLLCAVAAYNTGARNVYKAFKDADTKKQIIDQVNGMTYGELLGFLEENLPYEETRNYVVKVNNKMQQYSQWQELKE